MSVEYGSKRIIRLEIRTSLVGHNFLFFDKRRVRLIYASQKSECGDNVAH